MLEFKDCDVIINGQGVLCENASLNYLNSLRPMYLVGNQEVKNIPAGSIRSNVDISYFLKVDNDPVFAIIQSIKNNPFDLSPVILKVAGISGSFFLERVSLKCLPNTTNRVAATFVSFEFLSGALPGNGGS
jgi:hypothetical protein